MTKICGYNIEENRSDYIDFEKSCYFFEKGVDKRQLFRYNDNVKKKNDCHLAKHNSNLMECCLVTQEVHICYGHF